MFPTSLHTNAKFHKAPTGTSEACAKLHNIVNKKTGHVIYMHARLMQFGPNEEIDFAPYSWGSPSSFQFPNEMCVSTGGRVSASHPNIDTTPKSVEQSDSGFQFITHEEVEKELDWALRDLPKRAFTINLSKITYMERVIKRISNTVVLARIIRALRRAWSNRQ